MSLVVLKNQPIGIDEPINGINKYLHDYLVNKSGWINYNSYHRADKNDSKNGFIPEVYTEKNEYEEVFLNDKVNSSFFLKPDTMSLAGNEKTIELSIFFQVNTTQLYEGVTHRADEEARNDVIVALKKNPRVKDILDINTDINNVYAGFRTDHIKWDDMAPFHVFRVDFTTNVNYRCDWKCQFVDTTGGFDIIFDSEFS